MIHGAAQSSAADALGYATSLLAGHSGAVVAVDVGSDTLLFYGTNGGLFYGDYTGMAVTREAHPAWSDTRSVDLFVCPGTATG